MMSSTANRRKAVARAPMMINVMSVIFFVDEFANLPTKLVGKTERPSPLLEIFSTNLEKLYFLRCSPKFGGSHGIVGGKKTGKSGAVGKPALLDDEPYRIVGLFQQLGGVLDA